MEKIKNKEILPDELFAIKKEIARNLCFWGSTDLEDSFLLNQFNEDACHIKDLLTRTLTLGESNSALLISPRGGGKSCVLNAVINELKLSGILNLGIVVNLSGLLHVNDRLALREITKQLNVDSSCALKFSSFAENLAFILNKLKSGSKDTTRPIIFILEEFDLFCHHRNQTLLYNLFDVSQTAQAPICVLGLTCRLDAIELLEKRVKSRFSHRQIFLYPPNNKEIFFTVAENLLTLSINKGKYMKTWNKHIKAIFKQKEVKDVLNSYFEYSRNIRQLKKFLVILMSRLCLDKHWLEMEDFLVTLETISYDSKISILQGLSILQLSLVICMKHITKNYDREPFNFEMVHREYKKFCAKFPGINSFDRAVVFQAFDQLECLELVRPIENHRNGTSKDYILYKLMTLPHQVDDAVHALPHPPTYLLQWCSSDL